VGEASGTVRRSAVLAFALALAGCGGGSNTEARAPVPADCARFGTHEETTYYVCWKPTRDNHGRFVVRSPDEQRTLPVELPARPQGTPQVGHWRTARLSPNGETVLAQWSGECEAQIAYFIPAEGGEARPVTGRSEWSEALGWTGDGLARVRLSNGACGTTMHKPGVYLVDPETRVIRPAA
jgi:hypothetical protein